MQISDPLFWVQVRTESSRHKNVLFFVDCPPLALCQSCTYQAQTCTSQWIRAALSKFLPSLSCAMIMVVRNIIISQTSARSRTEMGNGSLADLPRLHHSCSLTSYLDYAKCLDLRNSVATPTQLTSDKGLETSGCAQEHWITCFFLFSYVYRQTNHLAIRQLDLPRALSKQPYFNMFQLAILTTAISIPLPISKHGYLADLPRRYLDYNNCYDLLTAFGAGGHKCLTLMRTESFSELFSLHNSVA